MFWKASESADRVSQTECFSKNSSRGIHLICQWSENFFFLSQLVGISGYVQSQAQLLGKFKALNFGSKQVIKGQISTVERESS